MDTQEVQVQVLKKRVDISDARLAMLSKKDNGTTTSRGRKTIHAGVVDRQTAKISPNSMVRRDHQLGTSENWYRPRQSKTRALRYQQKNAKKMDTAYVSKHRYA